MSRVDIKRENLSNSKISECRFVLTMSAGHFPLPFIHFRFCAIQESTERISRYTFKYPFPVLSVPFAKKAGNYRRSLDRPRFSTLSIPRQRKRAGNANESSVIKNLPRADRIFTEFSEN